MNLPLSPIEEGRSLVNPISEKNRFSIVGIVHAIVPSFPRLTGESSAFPSSGGLDAPVSSTGQAYRGPA